MKADQSVVASSMVDGAEFEMKRLLAVLDKINKIGSFIGMQPIPENQPKYALYADRIALLLVIIGVVAFAAYVVKLALMG